MESAEYRKASFKLMLMGSDNVARAYNDLTQYFYSLDKIKLEPVEGETIAQAKVKASMKLWYFLGNFLLEIRKGVTSQETDLSNKEMLAWMITDIQEIWPDIDQT